MNCSGNRSYRSYRSYRSSVPGVQEFYHFFVYAVFFSADLLELVRLRRKGRAEGVHDLVVLTFHRHPSGALNTPWQANQRGGGVLFLLLALVTCVAPPTKKMSFRRFFAQIYDWKHLYLFIFLV